MPTARALMIADLTNDRQRGPKHWITMEPLQQLVIPINIFQLEFSQALSFSSHYCPSSPGLGPSAETAHRWPRVKTHVTKNHGLVLGFYTPNQKCLPLCRICILHGSTSSHYYLRRCCQRIETRVPTSCLLERTPHVPGPAEPLHGRYCAQTLLRSTSTRDAKHYAHTGTVMMGP